MVAGYLRDIAPTSSPGPGQGASTSAQYFVNYNSPLELSVQNNPQNVRRILEVHFSNELEMLPEKTVEHVLAGGEVEQVKIRGAHQVNISDSIEIILTAVKIIKGLYEIYADARDARVARANARDQIKRDYPEIYKLLGDGGLEEFVDDVL